MTDDHAQIAQHITLVLEELRDARGTDARSRLVNAAIRDARAALEHALALVTSSDRSDELLAEVADAESVGDWPRVELALEQLQQRARRKRRVLVGDGYTIVAPPKPLCCRCDREAIATCDGYPVCVDHCPSGTELQPLRRVIPKCSCGQLAIGSNDGKPVCSAHASPVARLERC